MIEARIALSQALPILVFETMGMKARLGWMARDRIRADGGKVERHLPEAKRDSGPLFEDAAE